MILDWALVAIQEDRRSNTPLIGSQTGNAQQPLPSLSDALLERVFRTVACYPLLVFRRFQ